MKKKQTLSEAVHARGMVGKEKEQILFKVVLREKGETIEKKHKRLTRKRNRPVRGHTRNVQCTVNTIKLYFVMKD